MTIQILDHHEDDKNMYFVTKEYGSLSRKPKLQRLTRPRGWALRNHMKKEEKNVFGTTTL